jgi:hypothetical protein
VADFRLVAERFDKEAVFERETAPSGGKGRELIYQVSVSGSDATIVSSTQLSGVLCCGQPWLFQKTFAAPGGGNRRHRHLVLWSYPAGGKPIRIISSKYFSHNTGIFDITFSVAPH